MIKWINFRFWNSLHIPGTSANTKWNYTLAHQRLNKRETERNGEGWGVLGVCTISSGCLVASHLGCTASQRSTSLRSLSVPLSHAWSSFLPTVQTHRPFHISLSRQDRLACEKLQAFCRGDGRPQRWSGQDAGHLSHDLPLHQCSNRWSSPSHLWQTARRHWWTGLLSLRLRTAWDMPDVNLLQLRRGLLWTVRGCSDRFSRLCCCGEPAHGVLN